MGVEVSQHVRYGVEPEVVDVALPILINRQTQVLGFALEVEGEDVLARTRLALTNHKQPVASRPTGKHQLSCTYAGQRAMEPRVTCQTGISI